MFYLDLIFVFIFGLIIGSFLNCFIWRLHTGESLGGRSYCPQCRHQIAWYDNLPILSFIFLRGKCRHCGGFISWQYPLVELATGALFVYGFCLGYQQGLEYWLLFKLWFVIAVLIVVFVYDLKWQLILDKVILPASGIIVIVNLFLGVSWFGMLISAIIGVGFFLLQFVVSRGLWIGGGDIRLGLFMGLALGSISLTIAALFFSYLIGSIIGVGLISAQKKEWSSQIPLGVFLAVGTIVSLFWGTEIVGWYLRFF